MSATAVNRAAGSRVQHHSWVKVKLHNYVCRKCGTRKVNVPKGGGWAAEWHRPDGSVLELPLSPKCEVGPQTPDRLVWLANWQAQQPVTATTEVRG